MGFKFNSGRGGIICERCSTLIVAGWKEKDWCYYPGKSPEEHIQIKARDGHLLHYCSQPCRDQHYHAPKVKDVQTHED